MELRNTLLITLLLVLFLIMTGCATSNSTDKRTDDDDITVTNTDIPLIDYMRRIPGIQINQIAGETSIMVRGASSITGENSPLFVLDRSPLGYNFSRLENSVSVSDIATINVLKGSEAMQRYGMRASNGAIVVRTKQD